MSRKWNSSSETREGGTGKTGGKREKEPEAFTLEKKKKKYKKRKKRREPPTCNKTV